MANTNEILGQIGAAKMFCGGISQSLGLSALEKNEIQNLENELLGKSSAEIKADKELRRKAKRLKRLNSKLSKNVNTAIGFLGSLAAKVDIGKEQIIDFITNGVTKIIPSLEWSVKAALLANIKQMTSCALDVKIPDELRKKGFLINESEIDLRRTLLIPPTSEVGRRNQYFGVERFDEEGKSYSVNPYELARAEDMNAFIWFVKNCAKFVNPIVIAPNKLSDYFITEDICLSEKKYKQDLDNNHKMVVGTILKDATYSNTLYLINDVFETGTERMYNVVPISHTWTSVNWYNQKGKGLCNFEYSNTYNSSANLPMNNFRFKILPRPFLMGSSIISDLNNDINTLVDVVNEKPVEEYNGKIKKDEVKNKLKSLKFPGVTNLKPKRALFDYDGKYNRKGRYTINEGRFIVTSETPPNGEETVVYKLIANELAVLNRPIYLIYNTITEEFIFREGKSITSEAVKQVDITKVLTECYKGETVYEFNYDYLMSIKLFDAKIITANLINRLLAIDIRGVPTIGDYVSKQMGNLARNVLVGIDSLFDKKTGNYNEVYLNTMVDGMIQSILDSETEEYKTCFYDFSNEDYIRMEEETALKVINGQLLAEESLSGLTSAYDILDAYNTKASLQEQSEIITRSLRKAFDTLENDNTIVRGYSNDHQEDISDSSDPMEMIKKILRILTQELTYCILSPKVMMLIMVNRQLMNKDVRSINGKDFSFSEKDIINTIQGVITPIIKEVIDMIQKELLRVILSRLTKILNYYVAQLGIEYAKKWINLLKSLLNCFKFNRNKIKGDNDTTDAINNALNSVDYADLDELAGQIIPNTKPC